MSDSNSLTSRLLNFLSASKRERDSLHSFQNKVLKQLAILGAFSESELTTIVGDHPDHNHIMEYVLNSCEVLKRDGSSRLLTLKDNVRNFALERLGLERARKRLLAKERKPSTPLEELIREIILSGSLPTDSVTRFGTQTVGKALFICKAVVPELPSLQGFLHRQKRIGLQQWIAAGRQIRFVNRTSELTRVQKILRGSDCNEIGSAIIELNGAAGTGKTELIRQVLMGLDPKTHLVAVVDFERPITKKNVLKFISEEIANSMLSEVEWATEQVDFAQDHIISETDLHTLANAIDSLRIQAGAADKKLLIVLDSFEMFFNEYGDVLTILDFIEALINTIPNCIVLVANRLSGFKVEATKHTVSLHDLTESDVRELCKKNQLSSDQTSSLVKLSPGFNPLLITITMQYLKLYGDSEDLLSDEKIRTLNVELRNDFVFRRVIDKLPSPALRKLAATAIPLRRVSRDILAALTSDDPSADQLSGFQLDSLFEQLKTQIILFDLRDGDLYLRQDLRKSLLRVYRNSDPEECRRIKTRVYDYLMEKCQSRCTLEDYVDRLYYALCLRTPRSVLESIWNEETGTELNKYIDEFSRPARAWFKCKMGISFEDNDLVYAFREDFISEIQSEADKLFSRGRAHRIVDIIERKNAFDDSLKKEFIVSYLVGLAFQFQHDWTKAIEIYSETLQYVRPDDYYQLHCLHNIIDCYIFLGERVPAEIVEKLNHIDLHHITGEKIAAFRAKLCWISSIFKLDKYHGLNVIQGEQYERHIRGAFTDYSPNRFARSEPLFDEFILLLTGPCPRLITVWGKHVNFRTMSPVQRLRVAKEIVSTFHDHDIDALSKISDECRALEQVLNKDETSLLARQLALFFERIPHDFQFPPTLVSELRKIVMTHTELIFPYLANEGFTWGTRKPLRYSDITKLTQVSGRKILNFKSARRSIVPTFRRMADDGYMFDLILAFARENEKFANFERSLARWVKLTGIEIPALIPTR